MSKRINQKYHQETDRDVNSPNIHIKNGDWVMLTLVPKEQHAELTIQHRLNKFSEDVRKIRLHLCKMFKEFEGYVELSEPVASNGSHYPRLHYHILGRISSSITYLLTLGYFVERLSTGYHHTKIEDEKHYNAKYEYIIKQREQWKQSPYTFNNKLYKILPNEGKEK